MEELSLNVLDLAQNSITAGAGLIEITVDEQPQADTLEIVIRDNGRGMDEKTLARAADPFFTTRTTRHVGLGLPFFQMAAQMSGGRFSLESQPGRGTTVTGVFGLSHIDRPPLGDMNATILTLIQCNPTLDFVYHRRVGEQLSELDTRTLRAVLEEVPLSSPEVLAFIEENLRQAEEQINGGKKHENP